MSIDIESMGASASTIDTTSSVGQDNAINDAAEYEIFKRRNLPDGYPRILKFADLNSAKAKELDPAQFKVIDLVNTLIFYTEGIGGVEALRTSDPSRPISFHGNTNWEEAEDWVEWEVTRNGGIVKVMVTHCDFADYPSELELRPAIELEFDVSQSGIWQLTACNGIWSNGPPYHQSVLAATSVLMSQFLLEEIALARERTLVAQKSPNRATEVASDDDGDDRERRTWVGGETTSDVVPSYARSTKNTTR